MQSYKKQHQVYQVYVDSMLTYKSRSRKKTHCKVKPCLLNYIQSFHAGQDRTGQLKAHARLCTGTVSKRHLQYPIERMKGGKLESGGGAENCFHPHAWVLVLCLCYSIPGSYFS